ncbi:MAG: hypothetical protein JO053_08380 [Acidobacteria bacterium]|nr:hypothetical protein [Acidobacteriota bacterium]
MKKIISTFIMMSVMAIAVPMLPTTAVAATASKAVETKCYRTASGAVRCYKQPNIYQRHRKAFNLAGGAILGTILGGVFGGKKGALVGALAGTAGGAIYTHYQRPKNYRRYYRP